jgi:hypothetical protein
MTRYNKLLRKYENRLQKRWFGTPDVSATPTSRDRSLASEIVCRIGHLINAVLVVREGKRLPGECARYRRCARANGS